jgi:uncharacterized protein YkwD
MHISNFTITCIKLSLFCGLINLAILRVATAQNNESPPSVQIETVQTKPNNSLESSVLAEINRARTDPLGYAAWLEQQKQYYQGIVLALPGEKPLRINKGLKALEEAIAFLQQQKPLPALTTSDVLTENARTQVAAIARREANSNINIQNITYGRVTPEGIVMELIVDSRSPNRHHRTSLFNPQANATGILCQRDPQYENICAIAYEGDGTAIASNELSTTATPEVEESSPSSKTNSTDRPREIQIETVNNESPVETTPSNTTPQVIEVPQPETKPSSSPSTTTANTSDNAPLLNKIERGTLDTGDKTIPDDGSFYDSYPLEGKAGESFIITLESDDFDTFLALMDPKGTILEQNDDIDDKNSNSLLRITLPDDGVYSLIINAYNEGGKGEYVLTVRH